MGRHYGAPPVHLAVLAVVLLMSNWTLVQGEWVCVKRFSKMYVQLSGKIKLYVDLSNFLKEGSSII